MKLYLVPPVLHGKLTVIYSKSPHKETRVTWQAQTQNQWAELDLPKSCPSSTRTGGSCESRTGVSGHRAALRNSPTRAAALLAPDPSPALASPPRTGTRRCRGLCWLRAPRTTLPQQRPPARCWPRQLTGSTLLLHREGKVHPFTPAEAYFQAYHI